MESIEPIEPLSLVPMEPEFRVEIKRRYTNPLQRNGIVFGLFISYFGFLIISDAIEQRDADLLYIFIPFLLLGLVIVPKIYRYKRYYYQDYQLGYVVKELVAVTKVFDTPSGVNIYWLSSDAIKTFVPDPYRHLREGDLLFIYYLRYAKEYLGCDLEMIRRM